MRVEKLFKPLLNRGFTFYAGVPCSILKPAVNYAISNPDIQYINATSEGEAIAIATGSYLAGKKSVVMIQNSGLGNAINPLTSLTLLYHIPLLLIITKRGYPGDAAEHSIMVKVMLPFLEAMEIPYDVIKGKDETELQILNQCCEYINTPGNTRAIILEKESIEPYALKAGMLRGSDSFHRSEEYFEKVGQSLYSRYSMIETALQVLENNTKVISTTGMITRELFTIGDSPNNFYLIGAMGSASGVGLGYALNRKDNKTAVMDGDGAVLMKMGTLATIGRFAPLNFIHIVFDNECYASTGGQESSTAITNVAKVALACGYKRASLVSEPCDLKEQIMIAYQYEGPSMIVVKVKPGNLKKISRVTWTPEEITRRFVEK